MDARALSVATLALLVSSVNCQEYVGVGIAGLGIFVSLVIIFAPIIVIALISWCLVRMMRTRRSVGVVRVMPATTTMIQVPQPIVQQVPQAHMHFSFGVNDQPQHQASGYQVRLPDDQPMNHQPPMQQQQFKYQQGTQPKQNEPWTTGHQQNEPWTTGQQMPSTRQPWQQNQPMSSNAQQPSFGSQAGVNQGYQPEAPPAYEFDERKEGIPKY